MLGAIVSSCELARTCWVQLHVSLHAHVGCNCLELLLYPCSWREMGGKVGAGAGAGAGLKRKAEEEHGTVAVGADVPPPTQEHGQDGTESSEGAKKQRV